MRSCFGLLALLVATAGIAAEPAAAKVDRWAAEMRRIAEADEKTHAATGGVVFVGSSSIRLWELDQSFPRMHALNRGFGGSELADSVRHVELLVLRHQPRVVVVYAGDNDIAKGKSPETVVGDFKAFVAAVHGKLPKTKIVYIAIKPSLARWKLAEPMQQANGEIKAICEKSENCQFVDVWPAMLDADGKPRGELFVKDGLHMTPAGYEVWTALVKPHVE